MKDSAAAPHALVATFNVRGVGKSGGSAPWLGFGIGKDADDFAAVERAAVALTGRSPKLYRVVGAACWPLPLTPRATRTGLCSRSTLRLRRTACGGPCSCPLRQHSLKD